jgi:hypothetical protein
MIRTQLYLDEDLHGRLRQVARDQGRTISELVRDALHRVYGGGEQERRSRTLRAIEGLWKDRDDLDDGDGYVRRLRRDTRRSPKRRE